MIYDFFDHRDEIVDKDEIQKKKNTFRYFIDNFKRKRMRGKKWFPK